MFAPIISDPAFYAVAIPAVIFLGLAKGGFSGVATGATPLLALYLPPLEAAALLLPIVLCQDAISVHAYWRDWSGWNLKILLPGAVLGLVLGYLFAAHVSDDTIRILIGLSALIFVATTWLGPVPPKPASSSIAAGLFWGTVAGFLSFASQGGGPPFQVFTLPQRLSKMTFVGTTAIFFAVLNIIKVVPYAMLAQFTVRNVSTSLALLPLAVFANLVGIWLIKVVPTAQFFRITYVLLFVLGSVLFCQGAAHMLREAGLFDLAQTNPACMSASLALDNGGTRQAGMTSDYDVFIIDRGLGDNQKSVTFCDADACCSCGLSEGDPDCLRRKAEFCLWLAVSFPRTALGATLNKLGLDLIKDSEVLERERAVLSRRKPAAT